MNSAQLAEEAARAARMAAIAAQEAAAARNAGQRQRALDLANQAGLRATQYAAAAQRQARREAATW